MPWQSTFPLNWWPTVASALIVLHGCAARLRSDPNRTIRRFADLLGVDHERVRMWIFARAAAEPRADWSKQDWVELAAQRKLNVISRNPPPKACRGRGR
jgi:hypothetical protein